MERSVYNCSPPSPVSCINSAGNNENTTRSRTIPSLLCLQRNVAFSFGSCVVLVQGWICEKTRVRDLESGLKNMRDST